ncbi:MAG: hypothetical protein ACLFO5_06630 [Opitutales bacterium]
MKIFSLTASVLIASALSLSAGISLTVPTDDWTAIQLGERTDYPDDEQAKKTGGDIVGDESGNQAGFFRKYDRGAATGISDDELGYRIRLGDDTSSHIFVGLDIGANGSSPNGKLDMFIHANIGNNNPKQDEISFFDAGDGLNNSPDTSTVGNEIPFKDGRDQDFAKYEDLSPVSESNDSYLAANPDDAGTDLNGDGKNDFFLSFKVSMQKFNDAYLEFFPDNESLTENTLMSQTLMTSTNKNNFNQDFGGLDESFVSNQTWTDLGAGSEPEAVPEGAASAMIFGLLGFSFVLVCRRK